MSMNKDALEGMAAVLRENGYEVSLKESDNESTPKKPYVCNRFNKIRDLNLNNIFYDTCLFLRETVVNDFNLNDFVAGSYGVTIGYIDRIEDDDDDEDDEDNYCVDEVVIKTNRNNTADCTIVENLSKYDYVIKLSDVFKLMADNEAFGV